MSKSAAQQAADAHAFLAARSYFDHRSQLQSMLASRPGVCMADGLDVHLQRVDGDFALDDPVVHQLLQGQASGPRLRAAPAPAPERAPAPAGPSALASYMLPAPPAGAPYTAQRMGEEVPGAVYGPGNVLANSSAALAGTLRGATEIDIAKRLREGIEAILAGRANHVRLSQMMELYNTAGPRRQPVVRLRVRNLPITVVEQAIPATGGVRTQWRPNPSQNASTLPARNMTAQQMRQASVLAGERGLPTWLRWSQGRMVGGVLTFAPSAALDFYNAADVDFSRREFNFKGKQFMVDSARSQSGNLVGFAGGAAAVALVGGAVVGAPLVLIGLGVGITLQVVWNWTGAADATADQMRKALD